jgi:nitric oxide reductase subunit B
LNFKKLWIGFIAVIVLSFSTIGYFGLEIFREAPPVPAEVVDAGGRTLFTGQDIRDGQNVWQSMGGQELGTIWGHGSYVAPDWSADWLHREATFILDRWAEQDFGQRYSQLVPENQALLRTRLQEEIRRNTYDYSTGSPPPGWRRAFSSLRPCRASSLAFRDSA